MSPELREKILRQIGMLPADQQEKVLAFAKSLAPPTGGVSGKDLLKVAGSIGQSDLRLMTAVIEEGCERVDRSEW